MAKLKLYSAFDSKVGDFSPPYAFPHPGQAERFWQDLANDGQSLVSKHPKDYAFYQVGEYDTESGEVKSVFLPVHFLTAEQVKDRGSMPLPLASGSR